MRSSSGGIQLSNNLFDKLRGRSILGIKWKHILFMVSTIILCMLTLHTYEDYKNTIVSQQQQNMLGIARAISRSIGMFVSDIQDGMRIIALDKEIIKNMSEDKQRVARNNYTEKLLSYYEAEKMAVKVVRFYDKTGRLLTQYPLGIPNIDSKTQWDINYVVSKKNEYIGEAYFDKNEGCFYMNLYEPVFDENNVVGVISVTISLDDIYNKLINPVKVGKKGYVMVKDEYGTIIMHPVKAQVGIDVIETRKQMHPDLDFKELEKLINDQLSGKEGTALYHSYWWGDNILKKVMKLNAYTPIKFGKHFWIIAVTMSYDEIQDPIVKFLGKIIGTAILIIIIMYTVILELIKMKKNKDELEKETKYLKMLNEASELRRKEEAELYHSHKLKIIGTLAGGIAHDINNLLTPILGYSELLLMTMPKDNEYYDDVKEIYNASQKGKDLIEQILLFSRNDNQIIKVEAIDINRVTKDTLKLLKAVVPRNIIIMEDIEKECGFVCANATQIHQVIFNLCTNAYQAIKDNNGKIEISLNKISGEKIKNLSNLIKENRHYVEIKVSDNGIGMDDETKTKIFDPFFTTKGIGEGTGIGLYVVQRIIDKYEGVIIVESELGVGSCFKVYLPLIQEEVEKEKVVNFDIGYSVDKNILIVDDNEEITKVLKRSLEHKGYNVVTETDSLKALKILKSDYMSFDLVITDYIMPGINGGELATQIKKVRKDIGVIVMTGHINENEISIGENKSIDACILKPIEINELTDLIKNIICKCSNKSH